MYGHLSDLLTVSIHVWLPLQKLCILNLNQSYLCGWQSEYVNPYIPHTNLWGRFKNHQVDYPAFIEVYVCTGHLQTKKRVLSYMTLNVLSETRCHQTTQTWPSPALQFGVGLLLIRSVSLVNHTFSCVQRVAAVVTSSKNSDTVVVLFCFEEFWLCTLKW